MKLILLCCTVFVLLNSIEADSVFKMVFEGLHRGPPPPVPKETANIQTEWIKQRLDHFNQSDSRAWEMRYLVNSDHFMKGAPIFIFVGGEWPINPAYLQGGHMFDMGKELNGYLIYTEHRYYGKSRLFRELTVDNLKYLNVDQALADLAHFIKTIKKTTPGLKNSKVVLVGGSYSATMVTWFQRIYPGLAIVSWGSSAPLLAKVDFMEYHEIVGQSIKLIGGQKCYDRIERGIAELEKMISSNKTKKLLEVLHICDNFNATSRRDVASLFSSISGVFGGLVQGHSKRDKVSACAKILNGTDDVSGVTSFILSYFGTSTCNDFSYKDAKNQLEKTHKTSIMRLWMYQTCNEFGWYHTSGSMHQPFGSKFPVEFYIHLCKDLFGNQFSNDTIYDNADRTNTLYGGMNPNVSNVILTHGQIDPWRAVGIQQHKNGQSNVTPLYSHCMDLASVSESDTLEMKLTKETVLAYIYRALAKSRR